MQLYNAIICSYDNHTFSGSDMSGDLNYNNPPPQKKKKRIIDGDMPPFEKILELFVGKHHGNYIPIFIENISTSMYHSLICIVLKQMRVTTVCFIWYTG